MRIENRKGYKVANNKRIGEDKSEGNKKDNWKYSMKKMFISKNKDFIRKIIPIIAETFHLFSKCDFC